MSSILTNNGAMVALQTLKGINSNMAKTQNEISTGKSVATAKDNAAIWATAKIMESDESSFKAIRSQLNVAEATVAVARNGAEQITDLLRGMKDLAVSAANDSADHGKINTDIVAKKNQITAIIDASQMNGINLLKTDVGNGSGSFSVLASLDRGTATTTAATAITVGTAAFETSIEAATITGITSAATATTAIGEIEALIELAANGAASLGSKGKQITDQSSFVGKLADSLKSGIGSMVDADMEETSARLQALQVQQQLATQSLSIANQAPQSLLSLFRG
ncbi:flagellin [Paracoccus sp. (in: a-proteobacteria)]|uniref:flagellin N-terminal helical domain-containing protein n=1 Tax=Paracoccus sp. TaxID=267 RepID=UPI0026E0194D|nr:flagellin [Paracoccus sp. (in: a-proteobacteria)]MDO5370796.1 flagellin [Paracoccus sp. (in: a-proteobacteria)]